uniref:Uncharacterized protein n=1 Tax=Takifugu rubripes TaxID=31033 RepID=A0A3B5KJ44_TAKRU
GVNSKNGGIKENFMEAGVQRLSAHFTWPEFCDQRRAFHQDFVYNVTMFAATCGFPWSEVAQAALMTAIQLRMEVQSPPTPCPLAQVTKPV